MNIVSVILYFLSCYIIQTTFLNGIAIYGNKPDIVFVSVLCFAMIKGKEIGSVAALIIGVCLDLLCGQSFGPYTISLFLTAVVCGLVFENTFHHSAPASVPAALIFSLLYGFIYSFAVYLPKGEFRIIYIFMNIILPTALYNAVFALPLYGFVRKISCEYESRY